MGLVTSSNEASVVGTMTSAGTDVIEMPASTSRSTTGATVDVVVGDDRSSEVGIVDKAVVATVVGASIEATDDPVATGPPDKVGAATPETHKVVSNAKTTSHRPRCRNDCDFTLSPPGAT